RIIGRRACEFSFCTLDADGRQTSCLFGVRGTVVGGRRKQRFQARLVSGLVAITGTRRILDPGWSFKHEVTFRTDVWTNMPLRSLPHFDDVKRFLHEAPLATSVEMRCDAGDFSMTVPIRREDWRSLVDNLGPRIEFIERARQVAAHLGLNPDLPEIDT